ncbi:MAG: DUF2911 domain-containing protein [Niastella sp.]|uniref:DUF2911 domain-containing protein n=1 Tax=Niastella sp. TaxID=1869183 RepID=UPI00389B17E7
MLSRTLLSLLLLSCFFFAQAQKPNYKKGCLIYTLGKDTTAIGNFELKGYDFSITVADLTGAVTVSKLKGSFFPNGELQTVEGNMYKPVAGKDSQLLYTYKLYYDSSSTFIETRRNNTATTRKYPVKVMAANSLGGYALVYMPALLVNFAPGKNGDSLLSHHIVFNSARNFIIRKTGDRNFSIGSPVMGMFTLSLDKKGNLRAVDGIGTSWNIKGMAISPINMDSVIMANVTKDNASPHIPIANKLDSVQTIIGATAIKIRYSRPSVRGRVIFGEVVPYNRFWRTGADAATKLTLDQPLYFNGRELSAGEYSIFTIPSKNGWTIMFNKQANIWGTEYKAENDVLRVQMSVETLQETVELLTINVVQADKGGRIEVSWDNLKASVPFSTSL